MYNSDITDIQSVNVTAQSPEPNGILLVDKEPGISSYDVIRRLKKKLSKNTKIGHAGTLDPFATGLLIILIGRGTKLSDKVMHLQKGYVAKAIFGHETDTQDCTGEIIHKSDDLQPVNAEKIKDEIKNFLGEIEQMPPQYSAKKVNGKPAYLSARKGEFVQLQPKTVNIYDYKLETLSWPDATFRIKCSSGTYIRTLMTDLGRALGTYATTTELRRTFIGSFDVEDALNSHEMDSIDILPRIISVDKLNILNDE